MEYFSFLIINFFEKLINHLQ